MSRKRTRGKPRPATPTPRRPVVVLLTSAIVWRSVLTTSLLVGAAIGLRTLDAYARTRVDVQPTRIEWVDPPAWLLSDEWSYVLDDIENGRHVNPPAPLVYPETDIHDPRVCGYVYEMVAESAWVRNVRRVVKHRDGRVQVEAEFREPFAAVERRGMAYLIDRQGVRLPVQWRSEFRPNGRWLYITGVRDELPPLGEVWPGEALQAGIALVDFIYRNYDAGNVPFFEQLRAVDVSEYDEILERLRIITTNPRSYICWGHRPGKGYGVEASAEEKLATLTGLYREWQGLPDKGPFSVQDAPRVMFVRPETEADWERRP
ncbi:MAG: hypothetical protein D6744_06615 [Planctomycetota bacterium]|nr:MAG: hypothetical protein D6744_06615 [Planctomycetota bacterium]